MEAKAVVKFVRISPMKISVVLDLIRNKPIDEARASLMATPTAASPVLIKLLDSAAANAENNHQMNRDSLYISQVHVGPGAILKRIQPRARGSAYRIEKRTSHITMVLKEKE